MLNRILAFFENTTEIAEPLTVDDAAAVLLIEVMLADYDMDQREKECVVQIITKRMGVTPDVATQCIETAMTRQQESHDLFQFTRIINEQYGEQERYALLVDLWRVAFADDRLDKYEDHRIRRVSDMLHLHHSHFIQAKAEAQG